MSIPAPRLTKVKLLQVSPQSYRVTGDLIELPDGVASSCLGTSNELQTWDHRVYLPHREAFARSSCHFPGIPDCPTIAGMPQECRSFRCQHHTILLKLTPS